MKSSIKMQPRGFDSTYLTVTPRVLFNTYSPLSPLFKMAAFIPIPCRIPELHSLTLSHFLGKWSMVGQVP